MIRSLLAAVSVALVSSAAQADVVYDWQEIQSSPGLEGVTGRLVIADSAWQSGSVLYRATPGCGYPYNFDVYGCLGYQASPVRSFSFSINSTSVPVGIYVNLTQWANAGPSDVFDLTFRRNGQIDGSISAGSTTGTELLRMGGSGIWKIDYFSTNYQRSPCGTGAGCSGATGQWLLDIQTIPVPEPGILSLLTLGVLGMAASLRRQSAAL